MIDRDKTGDVTTDPNRSETLDAVADGKKRRFMRASASSLAAAAAVTVTERAAMSACRTTLSAALRPDDVAELVANSAGLTLASGRPGSVSPGQYVETRKEGFRYRICPDQRTEDFHLAIPDREMGGGAVVKLFVERGQDGCWNVSAFGAPNGTDDGAMFRAAFSAASDYDEITVPCGVYVVERIGADKVSMHGRGTVVAKTGASTVVQLGRETATFQYRSVHSLSVDGRGFADGFSMRDIGGRLNSKAGRWLLENVRIQNCRVGIRKPYGNISNVYKDMTVTMCDFGYWARGRTDADPEFDNLMHAGCDMFERGHWHGSSLAAFYIDDTAGNGGQHVWNECIIESNIGFGIFVKNHLSQNMPISVNRCWFEANARSPAVIIDGVSYKPRDLYFENTCLVEINSCKLNSIELVNSTAFMDKCFYNKNSTIILDANSTLSITNALVDDFKPGPSVIVDSVAEFYRPSGGTATVFATTPRQKVTTAPFSGSVVFSDIGSAPVTFIGTSSLATTTQRDGMAHATCQEMVQPASHKALHPKVFAVTAGKYYVTIAELKCPATAGQSIAFQDEAVLCSALQVPARAGEWSTIASISRAATATKVRLCVRNDGVSPATLRYGVLQVVEFASRRDALAFFNACLLVA